MNKRMALVWVFVFLAAVGYLFFIQDALPDHLAVHFDINGKPNGFQNKTDFIPGFLGFVVLMNGIFLALVLGIKYIPVALINIPWKKYWFATEERKAVAFEKLRMVMSLVGIFVCVVMLFTEHVIYQQNMPNPESAFPINGGVAVILVLSLLVIAIAIAIAITKPPTEE